jgi:hypothetical protein
MKVKKIALIAAASLTMALSLGSLGSCVTVYLKDQKSGSATQANAKSGAKKPSTNNNVQNNKFWWQTPAKPEGQIESK